MTRSGYGVVVWLWFTGVLYSQASGSISDECSLYNIVFF